MVPSRVELEETFILHQRPYRESSLLVEAFSLTYGRVALIARGARRPKSRLRSVLKPFHPLLVSWTGRRELMNLTGAENNGLVTPMYGEALLCAIYVNELIVRLVQRHDAHPTLFGDYAAVLQALPVKENRQPKLRIFEKRLLDAIGYGLLLDQEGVSGKNIDPSKTYYYRMELGAVPSRCTGDDVVRVSGNTLIALLNERLSGPVQLQEVKRLMRLAVDHCLDRRPILSRSLFR